MVVCTFLSAPIMYVSAWLLTIPSMDPKLVMNSLQNVSFNISIVSLVALVSHHYTLIRVMYFSCFVFFLLEILLVCVPPKAALGPPICMHN